MSGKQSTIQPQQTIKSRVQTGRPAGSVDQPLILSNATNQLHQPTSTTLQLRKANVQQTSYSTHKVQSHLSANGSLGGVICHKQSASSGGLSATQTVSRSRKSLSGRSVPISGPVVNQAQKYSQQSSLNNSSAGGYQAPISVPKQKAISPGNNFK
jgi:hypothetical protein